MPAACAAALVGCAGKGDDEVATSTSSLPPGCQVSDVDAIVAAFLRRPEFAPPGFFQVYGSNESDGRKFVTRRRTAAVAHERARLRLGERRRLIELRVAPQDVNHVRITFRLTRFAPDFRARGITTRLASGAGTIDCAHGRVAAWVVKGP